MSKIQMPPFDDEPSDSKSSWDHLPTQEEFAQKLREEWASPDTAEGKESEEELADAEDPDDVAELAALDGAEEHELLDDYEEDVEEYEGDEEEDSDEDAEAGENSLSGIPVDMTKEEYIEHAMVFAKTFGALRSYKMMLAMFVLYTVILSGAAIALYVQTQLWDVMSLVLLAVTVTTGLVTLLSMRYRVRKNAVQSYEAGNIDGYYGEITVTPTAIEKKTATDTVRIPLDGRTVYLEDICGMQFFAQGVARGIVIPARCATEELSAAIRKAVFSPSCHLRRRVVRRMPSLCNTPIERRDFAPQAESLYTVSVRYEPEDLKKILVDTSWKNYVASLPVVGSFAVLCGAMLAMIEENLPVFFVTLVAVMLGMLLLSMWATNKRAKMAAEGPHAMLMQVELNDYGVVVISQATAQTPKNYVLTRWQTLTRAVERADCMELIGAGRMIRIPKRCIEDADEFRRIVDAHYPPKA